MAKPDFGLILACYNEERVLRQSVAGITVVFDNLNMSYEIVFVDDKSSDNTVAIIRQLLEEHPGWKLVEHANNKGRGASVSDGIRLSEASMVGFVDIDLSTSPWYLSRLISEVQKGADIATAVRMYRLKPRTLFRWILSKGYRFLMRLVLNCDLQDTETGCKVFNKARILPILEKIEDMHWFWDTEVMARSYVSGYRIVEVPSVFIRDGSFTTVRVLKDTRDYLFNLIKFRHELQKMRRR